MNADKYTVIDDVIKDIFDTHPDVGKLSTEADITKITHFIFERFGDNQVRLLAVENPLYGGAK